MGGGRAGLGRRELGVAPLVWLSETARQRTKNHKYITRMFCTVELR